MKTITGFQRAILLTLSYGGLDCAKLTEALRENDSQERERSTRVVQRSVEALHRRGLVFIKGIHATLTVEGDRAIGAWYTTRIAQATSEGARRTMRAKLRSEAREVARAIVVANRRSYGRVR